ncbi:SERPING1 isoform 10 [Pongo abelii]|uniref:SERPING1 isoform 10 n=1 Tax=Pongo abelii TaxID=9601 RepID=A0A2J8WEF8_PONAB|nr:SERPING1 isoform 7 [Pongo abelii]PNJ68157.1 SERPING1 isoform 10 [Pongo abelii]
MASRLTLLTLLLLLLAGGLGRTPKQTWRASSPTPRTSPVSTRP